MDQGYHKPPLRVYFAMVIVVFFCTLSAADSVGFVPYYIDGTAPASAAADSVAISDLPQLGVAAQTDEAPSDSVAAPASVASNPVRIQIPAIGADLPVQNPATRDIEALDVILQKGPARYVDSAKLGASGNIIIFAHSSHLPIVHNKMFQAFNRIPDLKSGDTITLTGEDGINYLYSVISIRKTDVNDTIPLRVEGRKLTLVTCNTLTSTSARYVLEADFIGTLDS